MISKGSIAGKQECVESNRVAVWYPIGGGGGGGSVLAPAGWRNQLGIKARNRIDGHRIVVNAAYETLLAEYQRQIDNRRLYLAHAINFARTSNVVQQPAERVCSMTWVRP